MGEDAWIAGCDSCLTLLAGCVLTLLAGTLPRRLSSLCACHGCAILQQEQGKGDALTFPQFISIAIFGTLIGITFKSLLYYECLS